MIANPHVKFGYYQVGEYQTFSKVEAIEIGRRLNIAPTWHYNDEVFGAVDWTKEPAESLDSMYMRRAQDISNTHDYVILYYSGGADSHNMLESFVRSGARIDEIVSFHADQVGVPSPNNPLGRSEVFETAVPYVQQLKDSGRLPAHVKHRLVNQKETVSQFCKTVNWLDYPYLINSTFGLHNGARQYFREYIEDWRRIIESGKKLVMVWGWEKPRVMHEDRFYVNFVDTLDGCVGPEHQRMGRSDWYDEMFYSTPDMPEIAIKQAHLVKNFLKLAPEDHPWLTDSVTGLGHVIKHRPDHSWCAKWLSQDALSMIVYPWFNPSLYYEKKNFDTFFTHRDQWFWSDQELSDGYRRMLGGFVHQLGEDYVTTPTEKSGRKYKVIRSRRYWLE